MPAKAGIQSWVRGVHSDWIPACAGMTLHLGAQLLWYSPHSTFAAAVPTSSGSRASIITAYSSVPGFSCFSIFVSAFGCGP